jgi:hypothetical protein
MPYGRRVPRQRFGQREGRRAPRYRSGPLSRPSASSQFNATQGEQQRRFAADMAARQEQFNAHLAQQQQQYEAQQTRSRPGLRAPRYRYGR